jgi:hypothetical protein
MNKVVFPIDAIMYESENNDSDTVIKRPWRLWATKCKSPHTLDWNPRKPRHNSCINKQTNKGHLMFDDSSLTSAFSYGDDAEDGDDITPSEDPLHDTLQAPRQSRFQDSHPGRDTPPRPCVREPSSSSNRDTPPQLLQAVDLVTIHRNLSRGSSSSLR